MKKNVLILSMIIIISKLMGLLRETTMSYYYGTSSVSDAYIISITIPSVLFGFIAAALSNVLIPVYTDNQAKVREDERFKFINNLVNITLIICIIIIILFYTIPEQVVSLFAIGFDDDVLLLAVKFTKTTIPTIISVALITIFTGILQVENRFISTAFIGIPFNIILIISIILSSTINLTILALGYLISTIFQLLYLIPDILRIGYKHKLFINYKDDDINILLRLIAPILLSSSVDQINVLVNKSIASTLSVGGISALNYANMIISLFFGIIVIPISTVFFPYISKLVVEKKEDEIVSALSKSMTMINLIIIPISIGCIVLAEPLIKFILMRGAFNLESVKMTSISLIFYSFGMIGYCYRDILTKTFYAMKNSRTPVYLGTIGVIINILLNLILYKPLGIGGLALATSLTALYNSLSLLYFLNKKINNLIRSFSLVSFIKIFISSLMMGVVAKIFFDISSSILNQSVALIFTLIISFISYFIIISIFRIPEFVSIKNELIYKIGSKNKSLCNSGRNIE